MWQMENLIPIKLKTMPDQAIFSSLSSNTINSTTSELMEKTGLCAFVISDNIRTKASPMAVWVCFDNDSVVKTDLAIKSLTKHSTLTTEDQYKWGCCCHRTPFFSLSIKMSKAKWIMTFSRMNFGIKELQTSIWKNMIQIERSNEQ